MTADTTSPDPRRSSWDAAVETAGRLVGWSWSPWFAAAAALRGARALHPRGDVYVARVQPCDGPARALGERLAGQALPLLGCTLETVGGVARGARGGGSLSG